MLKFKHQQDKILAYLKRHPMLNIRKSADRGDADHSWLKSHDSFSFANNFDLAAH